MTRPAVVFVCLGNICRSPTAEAVLLHLLREAGLEGKVLVESAGTAGYHVGERPDPRTLLHGTRRGLSFGSRARRFVPSDFGRFTHVLAMDRQNLVELARLRPPTSSAHLGLLRDFDPASPPGSDVPDPYYGGEAEFEEVLDLCFAACRGLLAELRRTLP